MNRWTYKIRVIWKFLGEILRIESHIIFGLIMHDIKINKHGTIIKGEQEGWDVYIEDDTFNTGGYLILVTPPKELKESNGYDNWVENLESLEDYFQEAMWKVKWKED